MSGALRTFGLATIAASGAAGASLARQYSRKWEPRFVSPRFLNSFSKNSKLTFMNVCSSLCVSLSWEKLQ